MVHLEKNEDSSSAAEPNDDRHFLRKRFRKQARLSESEKNHSTDDESSSKGNGNEQDERTPKYPRLNEVSFMNS